jgi:hypothetical protein
LPKGASIEKQVAVHTGLVQVQDEDDTEPTLRSVIPSFGQGERCMFVREGLKTLPKDIFGSLHIQGFCLEGAHEKSLIICGRGQG